MIASVIASICIEASPADSFHYLQELRYHLLWNPHLQSISSDQRLVLGKTYSTTSLLLGVKVRGKNIVTNLLKNTEIEFENRTGALHYVVNYKLQPDGEKTLVMCTTTVSSDAKAFGFTKPVLGLLAKRELRADLEALKIAVEQQLG